jgi:hypothetical protein
VATIRRAYEAVHAEDKFDAFIEPGVGHVLSDAMWKRTKNPAVRRLVKRWRDAASASISLIVAEPRGGAVA